MSKFKGKGRRSNGSTKRTKNSPNKGKDRLEQEEWGADRSRNSSPRQNQTSRNDVSWYSRNPTLLQSVASIPFPYRPGMDVPWINTTKEGTTVYNAAIPGILALEWWPTVGYSNSPTDPASIVGKEIFAKVREKFSGSIDADAPDFVVYLMALDSVFSYVASLKRIYRILTAYTSENHYIPDALLQALGFSVDQIVDLKEHRMQFFQVINELVVMTRKFNIPAAFDIINRHYWLNDNVYMDAESVNSQFYIFKCLGYYKYNLMDISSGVKAGGLQMTTLNVPNTEVVEYLFQFGRALIDALAGSDDAYIISGYLMRAYDNFPVFSVDELPMDDRLIPHYDPEVLMQIENANPLLMSTQQITGATLTNDVTQDPGTNSIICKPHYTVPMPAWYKGITWNMEQYLSIRSDMPTVADVTIATRLKMGITNDVSTSEKMEYDVVCGSEILDRINIYWYNRSGSTVSLMAVPLYGLNIIAPDSSSMIYVRGFATLQSFDWHPILPFVTYLNAQGTSACPMPAGDMHNFTLLTNEQLKQINRVCLFSEFNSYGQL